MHFPLVPEPLCWDHCCCGGNGGIGLSAIDIAAFLGISAITPLSNISLFVRSMQVLRPMRSHADQSAE
jgi:hypothetical protein